MNEPEPYSVRLRRTLLILLALCTAVALIHYGQTRAPYPTIGSTRVPAIHCTEDNVLRLTPAGIECADGGH